MGRLVTTVTVMKVDDGLVTVKVLVSDFESGWTGSWRQLFEALRDFERLWSSFLTDFFDLDSLQAYKGPRNESSSAARTVRDL